VPIFYAYEWIALSYFGLLGVAALAARLPARRRAAVASQCAAVIAVIAGLALAPEQLDRGTETAWVRDAARTWLPALYVLFGYWLPAKLYRTPMPAAEARLLDADRRIDAAVGTDCWIARSPRALLEYLELSYALTYIFLPAGLAIVLLVGRADLTDRFWSVALLSHLSAYAALLVVQTRPPWLLEGPRAIDRRPLLFRRLNHFIMRHGRRAGRLRRPCRLGGAGHRARRQHRAGGVRRPLPLRHRRRVRPGCCGRGLGALRGDGAVARKFRS
jgi:hypothetical protein